jgi:hypothetical protein
MRVLFAISAACLLALIGAAFAIRRHILTAARQRAQRDATPKELQAFEAELHRDLRAAHQQKGFFRGALDSLSDPRPGRDTARPLPRRESAIRPAHTSPAPLPPAPPAEATQPADVELRKPPVSINGGKVERLDWEHFNKDFGDLSDPYQPRRSVNAVRSTVNNRR